MKFDILTYIFEIINFFVLLWILKKILYNPVISVLKKRKEFVESRISEAKKAESDLKKLKEEYENLLKQMEEVRKTKIAQITKEVQQEKEKLYQQMKKELDAQRQKFLDSLEAEKREVLNQLKEETVRYALSFVSKLLSYLSDKSIHKKLIDVAVEGIKNISKEEVKEISEELKERNVIVVETAYHIGEEDIEKIRNAIKDVFGVDVSVKTEERKNLIAGVRVHIASKMIDASIEGQISIFENILRDKIEAE